MKYDAEIRLRNAPPAMMKDIWAEDIRQAAEIVRAKFGFDTERPHKGFTITEIQK